MSFLFMAGFVWDLKDNRVHPEMALFPMKYVLRGFPRACPVFSGATYQMVASAKTLVRPWSSKKLLISELDTFYFDYIEKIFFKIFCVFLCNK
jgi:hypothetical protein